MAVPVSACMFPTEQISKPEPAAHIECCRGFLYHFGADEGITTHGRRFGLNKLIKTNFYNRHNECDGKERSFKCLFTSTRGLFTRLLTTRHAQGFYIYSLRVLLL